MIQPPRTAYCTTREAADLLGISLRTAQQWSESGLLEAWKTEGGHRRISRASVQKLIRGDTMKAQAETAPADSFERLKVLVIEDDSFLLKLYKTMIARWNLPLDLIMAGNGVDGLICIGRDAPDVLITDLGMPGLDGFKLIHSLASTSYGGGMEIIVVSGRDHADIVACGGLPAGTRVFPKPVPFDELRKVIVGMLERRAAYL
jgi:excisionase family DNA binding protein